MTFSARPEQQRAKPRCVWKGDWIIDLGPGVADGTQSQRGDKGGEIVAVGTPEEVAREGRSYTGHYLAPLLKGGAHSNEAAPMVKARRSSSVRQREAAE